MLLLWLKMGILYSSNCKSGPNVAYGFLMEGVEAEDVPKLRCFQICTQVLHYVSLSPRHLTDILYIFLCTHFFFASAIHQCKHKNM